MGAKFVSSVRFCPFCKESFDEVDRCPDHDLVLVEWHQLPAEVSQESSPIGFFKRGSIWVWAGSVFAVTGFFLPFIKVNDYSETCMRLAFFRAPNLWIILASAVGAIMTIIRRETYEELARVRLVIGFFGLIIIFSVLWTVYGIYQGAMTQAGHMSQKSNVYPAIGLIFLLLSSSAFIISSFRLGKKKID